MLNHKVFIFVFCILALISFNTIGATAKIFVSNTTDSPNKASSELPNFSAFKNIKKKKQAFVNFILPLVREENRKILLDRKKIQTLSHKANISKEDLSWLQDISRQYNIHMKDYSIQHNTLFFNTLLSRVDTIPPSLALAQSANESAWGTSRFATQGKNFFGQWCFTKNCGIVPSARDPGATHEVRVFRSAKDSVNGYMLNLNSHKVYNPLRTIRLNLRQKKSTVTGVELAHGLKQYSSRGNEYIKELIQMIKFNKWLHYDDVIS